MTSHSSSNLDLALTVFGGLTILWILLKAARGLVSTLRIYVLSEVWKGVDLASYGPWAVVTGATAGIGKAYAHELAKRGLNVILISRSLEKLKQVAAEIEERHGRSTRIIQMDFTEDSESYGPMRAALQGLEIGILVNNVGMVTSLKKPFLDHPNFDKEIPDLVNCNMLSVVKMTQIILPQMVARKKGIIINISSATAQRPLPLVLMYSASKRFVDIFSGGLSQEYCSKGIIVQSVLPLFVESNMTADIGKYFKTPADVFARKALNTVGLTNRTSGCLTHSIAVFLIDTFVLRWIHLSPIGYTLWLMFFRIVMKQD